MTRTIAYTSPFVPPEWIAAHALIPLQLIPRAATKALSEGLCPFAGAFAESALNSDEVDAVVLTTTCDQMRRIAEQLSSRSKMPVFLMNVPATWQTPTAQAIYLDELKRMGRWLVSVGGLTPDAACLATAMRSSALHPLPGTPGRGQGEGLCASGTSAAPLALVGGPLRQDDQWIFNCITTSGGHLALDATEAGHRTLPAPIDADRLKADPLAELARAYFQTIPDAFRRPDTLLHDYLRREIAQRRIRGIILVRHLWCDQWHAQLGRLRESTHLPIVEIDLGGGNGEVERSRNRIEALVNLLR